MLPKSFLPVTLRGVTAAEKETMDIGISFDTPTETIRLKLSERDARRTARWLLELLDQRRFETNIHSDNSSGNPNPDGSPQEGQSQWPPVKSSSP